MDFPPARLQHAARVNPQGPTWIVRIETLLLRIETALLWIFSLVGMIVSFDGLFAREWPCLLAAGVALLGIRKQREWGHWLSLAIGVMTSIDQIILLIGDQRDLYSPWSAVAELLPGLPFLLMVVAAVNFARTCESRLSGSLVSVIFIGVAVSTTEVLGWLPVWLSTYAVIALVLVATTTAALYFLARDKTVGLMLAVIVSAVCIHYAAMRWGWSSGTDGLVVDVHALKVVLSAFATGFASALLCTKFISRR